MNKLTFYGDLDFVSSQQIWLLLSTAQIDVSMIRRSVFSGHILSAQDDDLPQGLWLPILRNEHKAWEGLERCFEHLSSYPSVTALKAPVSLDSHAHKFTQKALSSENHLLLVQGEFLYRHSLRNIRKMAGFYVENIKDKTKGKIVNDMITGHISPMALKMSLEYIHKDLGALNEHLTFQLSIAGDDMGLADILWLPIIRRLSYLGWPLHLYPEVLAWHNEAQKTFPQVSLLDDLENLPQATTYKFWQKINWLGGRNLKSSLRMLGIIK